MSRIGKAVTAAMLASAIVLVAFATISLGMSSDGATTGHSAQTSVGEHTGRSPGDVLGGAPGGGQGEADGVLPGGPSGGGGAAGGQPGAGAPRGAGGGNLPFTGLLAIPVLLTGTGLLVAGLVIRRRTPTRATA